MEQLNLRGGNSYLNVDLIEEIGNDYIRYNNGIQICWGEENNVDNNHTTSIYPFLNTDYTIIATQLNKSSVWNDNMKVFNRTTSSFRVNTGGTTSYCWFAIGRWR